MEGFTWDLNAILPSLGETYLSVLFVTLLLCWDYPLLMVDAFFRRASRGPRRRMAAEALPVLVIIPSLLRKRDELTSMMSTVESIATNGYPGALTIVVSIDGTNDAPALYGELRAWAERSVWNSRTTLHV